MKPRLRVGWAGLLLAALVLIAFWPVAAGRRNFFHLDLRYEHLPVWDVTQKALAAGRSPFWIDGEYCGHPLLFTQEAPVFYPLTAPLLLTGAPVARLADLFSLFHFWLAGLGAFLLLRDLEADDPSALFGAVAWMLSARMVQSAIWPNAVAVSALLPWMLLGIVRIARGERRFGVICAAVSGGLALLASRPQSLLGAAPLLVCASAGAILSADSRRRAAGDLAIAGLLALALGAASLVPSARLYPEMSRAAGLTRAERDLNPIGPGSGLDMVFLPVDGGTRWPEAAAYPGLLAGLLLLAGVVQAFRKEPGFPRTIFLGLLAGGFLGLVFAFGEQGPYRYVADLPLIRGFRVPARYLVSWSLAVALGSALALSAILRRWNRGRRFVAAAAVLLLAGDLVLHAWRAAPTATAALDATKPDVVARLEATLTPDAAGFPRRFWSLALIPILGCPDPYRPAFARRFEPLVEALGMRFGLESVGGGGPALLRTEQLFLRPGPRAAEIAGVGALVLGGTREENRPDGVPPDLSVSALTGLPRALLVAKAIVVPPQAAVAATLASGLDPGVVAVMEEGEPFEGQEPSRPGQARLTARRPSRVEISTDAPGERILVLFDAYEKGWTAIVDGRAADVFRTDAAFRGVRVPSGGHRVVFQYRPPGLSEGVGLSLAGALGLILFSLRARDSVQRP